MSDSANPIMAFAANGQLVVVTLENPLVINEVDVIFPDVEIKGGTISAVVQTTATFTKLTKTS